MPRLKLMTLGALLIFVVFALVGWIGKASLRKTADVVTKQMAVVATAAKGFPHTTLPLENGREDGGAAALSEPSPAAVVSHRQEGTEWEEDNEGVVAAGRKSSDVVDPMCETGIAREETQPPCRGVAQTRPPSLALPLPVTGQDKGKGQDKVKGQGQGQDKPHNIDSIIACRRAAEDSMSSGVRWIGSDAKLSVEFTSPQMRLFTAKDVRALLRGRRLLFVGNSMQRRLLQSCVELAAVELPSVNNTVSSWQTREIKQYHGSYFHRLTMTAKDITITPQVLDCGKNNKKLNCSFAVDSGKDTTILSYTFTDSGYTTSSGKITQVGILRNMMTDGKEWRSLRDDIDTVVVQYRQKGDGSQADWFARDLLPAIKEVNTFDKHRGAPAKKWIVLDRICLRSMGKPLTDKMCPPDEPMLASVQALIDDETGADIQLVPLYNATAIAMWNRGLSHETLNGRNSVWHFNDLGRYFLAQVFMNTLEASDRCSALV